MGKSSMKKEKSDRINALRKKYDDFLEEDKKRKERNEYILGRLDKMRAASMALRVPYEMPRSRLVMGPPMIQYYNPQPREEPFVQTVPFANPYPILRDIPTKLTDNTNDSNIINEISKRFILIPKSSTLHVEKALTQTPQNDDPNWTSKYEILDQLKKCEKENIEFSNTGKSRNGKKISFEEDSVDKTTLQPMVTKDFTNEKREQVTNPTNYDIRKVADNKEYDIETFQRNLEEKARIQDEYTDNYNKDNINIDAYRPDIANNAIPIENYDSSAEQECKTNISKSKSQANYTEKDVEEYAPKEKTLEQNNNENIKYNQMEYTTNDNTNVNTSERNEEQVMINTENKLEDEKIPEQYDDSQVLQINSGEAGIEYYPEQNSESRYIQESENVNLKNYQQNNAIDSKELQNKYEENNAEYTNYPPEQQLGVNYEQYAQNRPAEYYDNTQEPLNQGQAQFEPQQYDNQNDQIQYQEHQQYDQNQPDQYQPYVHEQVQENQPQYDPNQAQGGQYDQLQQLQEYDQENQPNQYEGAYEQVQENQPQYDPNQVQGGQYDQLQQPQEYDQENQPNQYEGMYEQVQENQPQYDPNQAQGGQYGQLQQPQEYDLQTQPNQYEGMYEQVQENQPQFDMNKVQEGQYDQLQQPQEYDQKNQPNQSQGGQYQVQPQYEEGLFDQVQEYQSQYDPNQTDNVQYEYSQQDNDQNQVQYDSSQYENQYLEQSEHNIVGEAYDPNASGQTVDENIAGEVVTPVE